MNGCIHASTLRAYRIRRASRRPAAVSALAVVAILTTCLTMAFGSRADAFCGFYVGGAEADLFNNATMVTLMRTDRTTVLSMQNNYEGPPTDFAMVVPVPEILQEENVRTLTHDVFDRVDRMAAPRLVEYWEQDPCNPHIYPMEEAMRTSMSINFDGVELEGDADYGVVVEAEFTVAEYDIVILSADDSGGLERWLRANDYNIPDGAQQHLRPYIESGMYFFVAKVDVEKVAFSDEGQAMLSPLRFHYQSDEFNLPIRLGLINAGAAQDLIVHILAPNQRYEVANYGNVTIPTNIEVGEIASDRFGEFYAALFDRTLEENPSQVVTEYSWDASSCDPCPGPTLGWEDFQALGSDVTGQSGFVLTRLHARYTADNVGEDLVFRAAEPIVGGRAFNNRDGNLEYGASPSHMNNFQGRYIIRHHWEGPIACENPQRGIWGGPPNNPDADNAVSAASNTAFAPRGQLNLPGVLRQDVPELGLVADASANPILPRGGGSPPSSEANGGTGGGQRGNSNLVGRDHGHDPDPARNCTGCTSTPAAGLSGALLLLLGLVALRRH